MKYIDDIFFIWTHDDKSLNSFLKFADEYTHLNGMKSKIKFETNISKESVNFLDVTISITKNNIISTSVYHKPTDAHLYLNAQSCHPTHVIRNIPKGQFIRIRRICSDSDEYKKQSKKLITYFINRGYQRKSLDDVFEDCLLLNRDDLLDNHQHKTKDPQSTFICTWHPVLNQLPSILHKNFAIIQNDIGLAKIFKDKPTVAYRRKKNISNFVIKNDIIKREKNKNETSPCCGKCKTCPLINPSHVVENPICNITIPIKSGGNCKTKGIIYAIRCKKCNIIYVGQTGDTLANRFSKHRYDIRNRPF